MVSHATEPIGEHHPGAAHGRDMTTVLHVAADICQIHQQRRHPVTKCFLHLADLRGDDRLDAGRSKAWKSMKHPTPSDFIVKDDEGHVSVIFTRSNSDY